MTSAARLRRRSDRGRSVCRAAAEFLEERVLPTVTLTIDYDTFDAKSAVPFFNTQAKKDAMNAVAAEIGSRLGDTLGAFASGTYNVTDPRTFGPATATFSSATNELRVFVGGAALGGSTVGQGGWRSNTGLRSFDSNTDFEPYVGYIGFDADGSTTWDFSGSGSGTNFKAVARHEMLHVLGLGGSHTWELATQNGTSPFTVLNSKAVAANGGVPVPISPDGGHFAQTVNSILRPVVSEITQPTAIDWGALDDIGWDVTAAAAPGVYADVLARTNGGTWMLSQNSAVAGAGSLNSPTTFGQWTEAAGWHDVHTGDFNGDGRTDVVGRTDTGVWYAGINTGTGFRNTYFGQWNRLAGWHDVVFADFDADGRTDVAGRTTAGEWYVSRSTGTAFVTARWAAWNERAGWTDVRVGDFDGDRKADIAARTAGGDWYVALASRNTITGVWSFATGYLGSWNPKAGWHDALVADFDGNGKADIAGRTSGGEWWVSLAVGAAGRAWFSTTVRWAGWVESLGWQGVAVGDFGGDARPDVIGRTAGGLWYLSVNIGGSFFSTIPYGTGPATTWPTILYGDFAGNGKTDVLARATNGAWTIGESTGATLVFRSYGQWDESRGWRDVAASKRFTTAGAGAAPLLVSADSGSGQLQAAPAGPTSDGSSGTSALAFAPTSSVAREVISTPVEDEPREEADLIASVPLVPAAGASSELSDSLFADGLLLDALSAA